jgi:1-acyl-sn-glycerol-3-phosphate acyltransferase
MDGLTPRTPRSAAAEPVIAARSQRWHSFFHYAFSGFTARKMRAMRIARWGVPEFSPERSYVVFANHPSWWDGVTFMLLQTAFARGREVYTPMDAEALEKYSFMKRLGVFGVQQDSARGAIAFLRIAEGVLASPQRMLWMNAPGRFCDVRERPVPIAPGLVRLPEIAPGAAFVPLALDYPFWSESKPEMLAAFGEPIEGAALVALDRDARADALRAALAATMDRLAEDAVSRDAARFVTIAAGREGMGGIYGRWKHLKAVISGKPFDARHDPNA